MNIAAVTRELLAVLVDAGVPAVADLRDLNPPGVLVGPPSFTPGARLSGSTLTFTLWAVAPNAGRLAALDTLGPLLEQITAVLPCDTATPNDLLVPDGGDPLPGYTLTTTVRTCDLTGDKPR